MTDGGTETCVVLERDAAKFVFRSFGYSREIGHDVKTLRSVVLRRDAVYRIDVPTASSASLIHQGLRFRSRFLRGRVVLRLHRISVSFWLWTTTGQHIETAKVAWLRSRFV